MAAAALAALPLAREGAVASREVIKGLFSALGEPVLRAERVSSTRKGATITRTVASIPAWLPVGAALTWILYKWLNLDKGTGGGPPGVPAPFGAPFGSPALGVFTGISPWLQSQTPQSQYGAAQQLEGAVRWLSPLYGFLNPTSPITPPVGGTGATGPSGIQGAQVTPKPPMPVGTRPAIVGVQRSLSRPSAPGGVFRGF